MAGRILGHGDAAWTTNGPWTSKPLGYYTCYSPVTHYFTLLWYLAQMRRVAVLQVVNQQTPLAGRVLDHGDASHSFYFLFSG